MQVSRCIPNSKGMKPRELKDWAEAVKMVAGAIAALTFATGTIAVVIRNLFL